MTTRISEEKVLVQWAPYTRCDFLWYHVASWMNINFVSDLGKIATESIKYSEMFMEMKLSHTHGFKSQNTAFFRTSMSVSWWTWSYEHLLATTNIQSDVTDVKVLFIIVHCLLQTSSSISRVCSHTSSGANNVLYNIHQLDTYQVHWSVSLIKVSASVASSHSFNNITF